MRFVLLKRVAAVSLGLFLLFTFSLAAQAQAPLTLLPQASEGANCEQLLFEFETRTGAFAEVETEGVPGGVTRSDLLGCAIITGRISLEMIPYFITAMSNFLLAMVGIVCVLFLVIGGYYTIYGGIADNKEKGKKTVLHAFLGMVVAILAWTIVNVIMTLVTS